MIGARYILSLGLIISGTLLGLPAALAARIIVPEKTLVQLQAVRSVSSEDAVVNDRVMFTVVESVKVDNVVVIGAGAQAWGVVKETRAGGKVKGKPRLVVEIESVFAVDGKTTLALRLRPSRSDKPEEARLITVSTDSRALPARIPAGSIWGVYIDKTYALDLPDSTAPAGPTSRPTPSSEPKPAPRPAEPKPAPPPPEAKPAPAVTPPASGETEILIITSIPQPADIELDSNFIGTTPAEVRLTAGQHKLAVSKRGYKREERTLTAVPGAKASFTVELEKE